MRRPRPDPSAEELGNFLRDLPRQLGVWRAGPHGLYHLLLEASLQRSRDLASAQHEGGTAGFFERIEHWRHATAALVDWHARWAREASGEPEEQDVDAAIRRALDWRALETIQTGLASGDIVVAETRGWDIRLANARNHAVEVLDIVLQQVTVPAAVGPTGPGIESVMEWFLARRGRADLIEHVPHWVEEVLRQRALSDVHMRGLTLPADTGLGGLSLAEARDCYAFLIARMELAHLCTTILGSHVTAIWYVERQRLHNDLAKFVDSASADAFIDLCSYAIGRSPVSAPLIRSEGRIAVPAALISSTGFERTLLRAAAGDPKRAGRLGNVLGDRAARWAERLRDVPGALVAERVSVKAPDGRTLGDIDVAVLDPAERLLLIFETKWPVDAHTLQETAKVDEAIDIGRRQLIRLRDHLADGASVAWPSGWTVDSTTRCEWWVGTAQQLDSRTDSREDGVRTTALRLVEHVLPVASLADLQARLMDFPLPRLGVEYELVDATVRAGRYRLTFPVIEMLGEPPAAPPDRRVNLGWT